MQLAIDTSTDFSSIALADKGMVVAEVTWLCRQNHTVELMPNLIHLLHQAKVSLSAIDGIAVAKGPGSFNGLRVGISIAKGLAFASGIPLVGISTLEIEAFPYASTHLLIIPIHNAGRGEIAAARYRLKGDEWCQLTAEHLTTVEILCSKVGTKTLFCGELSPQIRAELRQRLGERAIIPPPAATLRRAGVLAELGWQRLQEGLSDDLATLQPLYLRRPPITQPKNKLWSMRK